MARDGGRDQRQRPARSGPLAACSNDPVELAAAEIRHVVRIGTLEMALTIGEIVFRHIYNGDIELLRRNGPKDVSFRSLAARDDIGISRASLCRAVAIYELSLRLPQIKSSRHLGVTHVRAVLGLPIQLQDKMLARAERERLDATALEAEAAALRRGRGGRPTKQDLSRAIDSLMRVAAMPSSTFSDRRAVAKMRAEDVDCALTMLEELEQRLAGLRDLLREAGTKL